MAPKGNIHDWETPKASSTLGLGAFGFAAALAVLEGGDFAYGGLLTAIVFSGMIFLLHAEEISHIGARTSNIRSLALPAIIVMVDVVTASYAFKVKILDNVTLDDFLSSSFSPIERGAIALFRDPESWFVVILLSGFWVFRTNQRPKRLEMQDPEPSPEFRAAMEHLKSQLASSDAASAIPVGPAFTAGPKAKEPIDYQLWDKVDPIYFFQFVYLWEDREPPSSPAPTTGRLHVRWQVLDQAVTRGELLSVSGRVEKTNAYTPYPRKNLIAYAIHVGEKPKFLFPEKR